jgi:hypothetical protein
MCCKHKQTHMLPKVRVSCQKAHETKLSACTR